MLTKEQYLLICLAEECAEVAQRASKALRFGLDEVQPGQEWSNRQRLEREVIDLFAITHAMSNVDMLQISEEDGDAMLDAKLDKLAQYMAYSVEQGVVEA